MFLVSICRYLSEFLYAWLMSTLSRADSSQIAEERILEEQLKGRSSKKTKKKKKGTLCKSFRFQGLGWIIDRTLSVTPGGHLSE